VKYFICIFWEMIKYIGSELRVEPKPRAQSARDLRSKPESKTKPGINWGGIWGEGLGSSSPENFENSYLKPCNLVYSSKFQANIFIFPQWRIEEFAENEHIPHFDPSQIQLHTQTGLDRILCEYYSH